MKRTPPYGCVYLLSKVGKQLCIQSDGCHRWLGKMIWICPLSLVSSSDVFIWDRQGPKWSKGHDMDHEVSLMDGAEKGCLHVVMPFIGRKTPIDRQQEEDDIHAFYEACIEPLFA